MGVVERSREVMAVMALHEALRNVCISSDWTYSVFWTIRPRPRLRGGLGCKAGDEGSLMLMWEDGYCRPAGCCSGDAAADNKNEVTTTTTPPLAGSIHRVHSGFNLGDDVEEEDPVRKAFRKMSIQLYNYGEGLMGKVASDKCHKWVFRESSETEVGPLNYWQSSFDSHPPEWMDQFSAGIQTIAVIQAGHGLLQLGSCKIVAEDLHFVLRMRYTFESLENQAGGGFLSQTFAPMRNRFFCGSPTGAAAPASALPSPGWQNNQAAFFHTPAASSDFRLRLGVACDPVIQPAASDDPSIASLRLSLQNGTSTFDFRNGTVVDQDGDTVVAAGTGQAFAGMKRPAGSTGGDVAASPRGNLLARRMQYQNTKVATTVATTNSPSTSFQELLQTGSSNNNFAFHAPRHEHDTSLMVQIPPVISSASHNSPMVSPMISPGGSNKLQKTGNGSSSSSVIQAALQDALERAARGNSSACSSPLSVRLSKLAAEQSQQYGSGTTIAGSQSGAPKPLTSEAPATTASAAATPAATPPQQHSHFPRSRPGTPASKDNYHSMNNNNANACLAVDHSSAMLVTNNGGESNHGNVKHSQTEQRPLHIPAATSTWENLKESCLDLPRRAPPPPPPTSGDVYPEFMESFFE
ncbi:uncharacterized protein LOC9650180 [Selaginella moellendorffii]|uniref:uncharacterized protein LOC9650180 n=1 Tax=Selaginella moellendorffii TaxID=88036 RepID=UPI000D1CDC42|nr:uncharacterized protein LOC9650180 [Selaginella moellendorffii]|eukprot:XP_024532578.1 uncharacterized protein LOC9650180 [Selaginella moellendorffii]